MAETDGTQTRLAVSYNAELRWRKLHASLTEASAWRCVPWASDSLLETVQVWASACGVGAVPAEMQVGMFAMDTALLRIWRGEMIAWPSLDAYPRYTADSPGVRHHVAWQPLAMAYAMLGRDLSVEELGRHFKLSRPLAPLPAGPDRVAPDLDMVGTWELEQCAFVWRDLVTVPICIKKGYLVRRLTALDPSSRRHGTRATPSPRLSRSHGVRVVAGVRRRRQHGRDRRPAVRPRRRSYGRVRGPVGEARRLSVPSRSV